MPPIPGMEIGPEPPPPPRLLPRRFEFRLKWSRNIAVICGMAFMLFGGLMLSLALKARAWFAIIPGIVFVMGFFMFRYGRQEAAGTIRAFRHGFATEGKIAGVSVDTTQSINGRHPWRLVYHFMVETQQHEGVLTSFDSTLGNRSAGQPLWVLYLRDDPEECTIYPPLA